MLWNMNAGSVNGWLNWGGENQSMGFLDLSQVLCFHVKQTKKDPQRLYSKNKRLRQLIKEKSSSHRDSNGLLVSLRLKEEDGEI